MSSIYQPKWSLEPNLLQISITNRKEFKQFRQTPADPKARSLLSEIIMTIKPQGGAMSISRRALLTSATAIGLTSALSLPPTRHLIAQASQLATKRNSGVYHFKLGKYNLISISDGALTAPAAVFAGNATPEQLKEALQQSFQSETLTADCNVLLVDTGTKKILIDTGSGTFNGNTAGKLMANLQQVQIKPNDITDVILTHAHSDHVGGLNNPSGLNFPNARYYINKTEWDFWTDKSVDLPKFKGPADMKKQAIELAQKQLKLIRDRVTLIKPNQEFLPGITAIPAYGHTPGHIAIRITSSNETLIHTADTVHISFINLWNPSWTPIFDADQEMAAKTRQELLAKVAADRTLMFAYHFPYPGIGNIRDRANGGFDWQPINWRFDA
jgi:glyoxylase-like metal-dependent hydrolase (beta-lactamase superfamily II)